MSIIKKLLNLLTYLLQLLFVSLYIIYEELIWERFAEPIYLYIKNLRLFLKLEQLIDKANRYFVLVIFLLSFVVGELFGIMSPIVAIKGYPLFAVTLYVLKLLIVAFAFWLFNIQKDKLLSFWLIEYSYKKIVEFVAFIKNTEIFKSIKNKTKKFKSYIKKLYHRFKERIFSNIHSD